jgi:hypothetical protein
VRYRYQFQDAGHSDGERVDSKHDYGGQARQSTLDENRRSWTSPKISEEEPSDRGSIRVKHGNPSGQLCGAETTLAKAVRAGMKSEI